MKRKLVAILSVSTSILLLAILTVLSISKFKDNEERENRISEMPDILLTTTNDRKLNLISLAQNKPTIVLLFNSECDHCQYEANSISTSMDDFKDAILVFISEEPLSEIKAFKSEYFPFPASNIVFARSPLPPLHEVFGTISYPNIFIYSKSGTLIKEFKGLTKNEAILKYLE